MIKLIKITYKLLKYLIKHILYKNKFKIIKVSNQIYS